MLQCRILLDNGYLQLSKGAQMGVGGVGKFLP